MSNLFRFYYSMSRLVPKTSRGFYVAAGVRVGSIPDGNFIEYDH